MHTRCGMVTVGHHIQIHLLLGCLRPARQLMQPIKVLRSSSVFAWSHFFVITGLSWQMLTADGTLYVLLYRADVRHVWHHVTCWPVNQCYPSTLWWHLASGVVCKPSLLCVKMYISVESMRKKHFHFNFWKNPQKRQKDFLFIFICGKPQ